MSPSLALQLLRSDPVATCKSYGFVVERDVLAFPHFVGGRCKIEASHLDGNVYQLKAVFGAGDYFFPYTHLGGPAGRCQVPDNAPDGTIAITGGMNGCALQVNQEPGYKMFYHDANAAQLATEAIGGTTVARVDYSAYEGPLEMAQRVTSPENPYAFQTLITVKSGGRWLVVHTGILRSARSRYSTYQSTPTALLTSFD